MSNKSHVRLNQLAAAACVGPLTARRLIREGKLPGFLDGANYICSEGEFQDWLDGNWTYRGIPSTPAEKKKPSQKIDFLHRRDKGAA